MENGYLKVVSYNVQCLGYGKEKEKILRILKELDADIIGLQELDINTKRSGAGNQLQQLAEELGYEYCYAKTIFYQGGGYGHGVLSKFPIRKSEVNYFTEKVEGTEDRAYSRQVITIDGLKLTFYNTHITYGFGRIFEPMAEIAQVAKKMAKDPCALLTGDFNLPPKSIEAALPREGFTVINQDPNAIDNMVITGPLEFRPFEDGNGVKLHQETGSDHYPIVAYIKFADGYDFKY